MERGQDEVPGREALDTYQSRASWTGRSGLFDGTWRFSPLTKDRTTSRSWPLPPVAGSDQPAPVAVEATAARSSLSPTLVLNQISSSSDGIGLPM